jgi:hypothetical protein
MFFVSINVVIPLYNKNTTYPLLFGLIPCALLSLSCEEVFLQFHKFHYRIKRNLPQI